MKCTDCQAEIWVADLDGRCKVCEIEYAEEYKKLYGYYPRPKQLNSGKSHETL